MTLTCRASLRPEKDRQNIYLSRFIEKFRLFLGPKGSPSTSHTSVYERWMRQQNDKTLAQAIPCPCQHHGYQGGGRADRSGTVGQREGWCFRRETSWSCICVVNPCSIRTLVKRDKPLTRDLKRQLINLKSQLIKTIWEPAGYMAHRPSISCISSV